MRNKGLFCFPYWHTDKEVGDNVVRWEETQPGWVTATDQSMMWHHTIQSGWRRRKGWCEGMFGVMVFDVFLPKSPLRIIPALLDMAEHLPVHGKQWKNSMFCLLVCGGVLLSLLNYLHLSPWVLWFLPSQKSPQFYRWGSEWGAGLLAGFNHDTLHWSCSVSSSSPELRSEIRLRQIISVFCKLF